MGSFATGVTIITLDLQGEVHGMTANAFASVSLDPPPCWFADHSARTHAHLHAKKRFGVNVLAESQRVISESLRAADTYSRARGRRKRGALRPDRAGNADAARCARLSGMPVAVRAGGRRPHHFNRGSGGRRGARAGDPLLFFESTARLERKSPAKKSPAP